MAGNPRRVARNLNIEIMREGHFQALLEREGARVLICDLGAGDQTEGKPQACAEPAGTPAGATVFRGRFHLFVQKPNPVSLQGNAFIQGELGQRDVIVRQGANLGEAGLRQQTL